MMLDMLAAVAREDTTIGANGRRRDRLKPRLKASARAIQQTPTATRASKARSRPAFPGPRLTQKRTLVSLFPRLETAPGAQQTANEERSKHRSGEAQTALRATREEAESAKAQDHHDPCRGFGDDGHVFHWR